MKNDDKKEAKRESKKYGIYVAAPDSTTAKELGAIVMQILNCAAGDVVKLEAIKSVSNALTVQGITIANNCVDI